MANLVKSVALPVARRNWLLYAWHTGPPLTSVPSQPQSSGIAAFVKSVPARAFQQVQKQWDDLKESKEGTFKHRLYGCVTSTPHQQRVHTESL